MLFIKESKVCDKLLSLENTVVSVCMYVCMGVYACV